VTTFAFQYFRCNLVGSAADGFLLLAVELQLGRQSEIGQLELHLVREEQIAQLQVTVYNLILLQVPKSTQHLQDLALHFYFSQSFPAADLFIDSLIYTQFE